MNIIKIWSSLIIFTRHLIHWINQISPNFAFLQNHQKWSWLLWRQFASYLGRSMCYKYNHFFCYSWHCMHLYSPICFPMLTISLFCFILKDLTGQHQKQCLVTPTSWNAWLTLTRWMDKMFKNAPPLPCARIFCSVLTEDFLFSFDRVFSDAL